ncbi:hypothetical protein F5Y04DRAFT_285118 [Hypomontagnella monticulosa]|nr:hypothetical protein F5Y04DRAFT_285118 [Hypomontagnella monticulosa]
MGKIFHNLGFLAAAEVIECSASDLISYEDDMEKFMKRNPGLNSRFAESIYFQNLTPMHCVEPIFGSAPSSPSTPTIIALFSELIQLPSWGNVREVQTVKENVLSKTLQRDNPELKVDEDVLLQVLDDMVEERVLRSLF